MPRKQARMQAFECKEAADNIYYVNQSPQIAMDKGFYNMPKTNWIKNLKHDQLDIYFEEIIAAAQEYYSILDAMKSGKGASQRRMTELNGAILKANRHYLFTAREEIIGRLAATIRRRIRQHIARDKARCRVVSVAP